jgi:hypothetical protein
VIRSCSSPTLTLARPTSVRLNPNIANMHLVTNQTPLQACWSASHTQATCKCCPVCVATGPHCGTWSQQQGTQFALRISSVTTAVARSMSQWAKLQPIYMQNSKLTSLLKRRKPTGCYVPRRTAYHIFNIITTTLPRSFVCSLVKPLRTRKLRTSQPHQTHSRHIQMYTRQASYEQSAFAHKNNFASYSPFGTIP